VLALFTVGTLSLGGVLLAALTLRARAQVQLTAPSAVVIDPRGTEFAGGILPEGFRAPDFSLQNQDGEPISMRDFRGGPAIVTFLYSRCEESCPPQAQQIRGALDRLGSDVPTIAVSVDPEDDTPASARRFLVEQRMIGRMDWALGSRPEMEALWRRWAIQPQLAGVDHQALIMLVDREGFARVSFTLEQATPERIAHDVRVLAGT